MNPNGYVARNPKVSGFGVSMQSMLTSNNILLFLSAILKCCGCYWFYEEESVSLSSTLSSVSTTHNILLSTICSANIALVAYAVTQYVEARPPPRDRNIDVHEKWTKIAFERNFTNIRNAFSEGTSSPFWGREHGTECCSVHIWNFKGSNLKVSRFHNWLILFTDTWYDVLVWKSTRLKTLT